MRLKSKLLRKWWRDSPTKGGTMTGSPAATFIDTPKSIIIPKTDVQLNDGTRLKKTKEGYKEFSDEEYDKLIDNSKRRIL